MAKDYQLSVNVYALGEAFLVNNTERLKYVSQLVVQNIGKDDSIVDEQIIDMHTLPNKLCEVFDKGVNDLKSIDIFYIEHGLRYFLTDIKIF